MCVGLCGLGQVLFHVLSSLALLDMESDGVNDVIPWFDLVGSKYSPKFNEDGKSIHPCSWREELV